MPRRPGLPSPESIVQEMRLPSPKAAPAVPGRAGAARREYRILRTNQVDEYEAKVPPSMVPRGAAGAVRAMVAGDNFSGKARKAAKISISSAKTKTFKNVKALTQSLPSEDDMVNRTPKITKGETSA